MCDNGNTPPKDIKLQRLLATKRGLEKDLQNLETDPAVGDPKNPRVAAKGYRFLIKETEAEINNHNKGK